jgi:hypothetical protein
MATSSLLSLPKDILILLPDHLHNTEDYTNLSSTCTILRDCMATASPNTILRLAAAQASTFFRPTPHFLATATARELGHWARKSEANEKELALQMGNGVEGLLDLALQHCGLAMQRIRQLHLMRFSIINPVVDIIDKCVGAQWYNTPNFWDGGVSDAYTIHADPPIAFFHLAIYGELFGPDFEHFLTPASGSTARILSVETRLEYIKYCVPDCATFHCQGKPADMDPRRVVKATGPYTGPDTYYNNGNIGMAWVLQSSRWRPHWQRMRAAAGVKEFKTEHEDHWHFYDDEGGDNAWKQRLLEAVMVSQGLEGLGMIRSDLQEQWFDRVRDWRRKIETMEREPGRIDVESQTTLEYPFMLGDLAICSSGYAG